MSGNIDHQQEPSNLFDPDAGDVNPVQESASTPHQLDKNPPPTFNPDLSETDPASSQNPKTVSQDLNDWLVSQRSTEVSTSPLSPTPATPPYPLTSYTMAPLDDPAPVEDKPSGWQTAWAVIREVGETIILTLVIFFLIQMVIRNFRVVGTSMVNNLHDGQYLIIDKLSYSSLVIEILGMGGPERGDVIVFKPPRNPEDDYVKRIIGLEGEKVQVINGQVFINDEPLTEPFQPTPGSYTMPAPVIVPAGQVFVLGDNRNNSNDSHNWGPLPVENIVGRAWLSYWPPDQWGVIPRDAPTEQATLQYFIEQLIPHANAQSE